MEFLKTTKTYLKYDFFKSLQSFDKLFKTFAHDNVQKCKKVERLVY